VDQVLFLILDFEVGKDSPGLTLELRELLVEVGRKHFVVASNFGNRLDTLVKFVASVLALLTLLSIHGRSILHIVKVQTTYLLESFERH